RAGDVGLRHSHSGCSGPRVSGTRCAATDAGVGHNARGSAAILSACLVGAGVSRSCDSADRAGLQSVRRRSAGCAGPAFEALMKALLEIRNLVVEFPTARGVFRAVDGLDLTLDAGAIVGIVGESGSGKSVAMLAVMGLIGWPGRVRADRLHFGGHDLLHL